MKRQVLLCFTIFLLTICDYGCVFAQDDRIVWKELPTRNIWLARHQIWGSIKFSAIKIHLGYYRLALVDIRAYRDNNLDAIRAVNEGLEYSNNLLDSGIKTVFKTWRDQSEIMAVAPAGWSKSLRSPQQSGLLNISGKTYADFDERKTLSAIVCLNSPFERSKGYDYQIPTFYTSTIPQQKERAERCEDAVQVGPRVVEDISAMPDPRGIGEDEKSVRPSRRVIFAVDNPGRSFPKDKPNNKLKQNARDAYIIVTENDVHLWDVQEMLLSPEFYGLGAKPLWAVNMAGGGPSGLVAADPPNKEPIVIGNPSGIIGSALVVTLRK